MVKSKNKNIVPIENIEELKDEIFYKDFEYKEYFHYLCDLIPNNELEKIEIKERDKENFKKRGLVYIFVVDDKVFKIGHSINSITERVQSYNCGKTKYRMEGGTNSTTNYFILQSLLKINKTVNVFAFFPEQPKYEVFGKKYQDSLSSSKRAEKEILSNFFKKYGKKTNRMYTNLKP